MNLKQYLHVLAAFWRREWLVRYGQSFGGVVFLLANPVLMVGLKWVNRAPDTPLSAYHFFFFGLIWWLFLSSLITNAQAVVSSHTDLVRKNAFPRSILVLLPLCLALVDWSLGVLLFFFFDLLYFPELLPQLAYLLPLFLTLLPFALGLSALLVSILFSYPKLRYALPFLLILVFISCQFFQGGNPSEVYIWLNPVAGFMTYESLYLNFHLAKHCIYPSLPFLSLGVGLVYMVAGLLLFRFVSPRLADF
jgi:ABC-type polysaccharide/polyol phosphate export permease